MSEFKFEKYSNDQIIPKIGKSHYYKDKIIQSIKDFIKYNKILIEHSKILQVIYDEHKDEDGFLYVSYCGENVFGNC